MYTLKSFTNCILSSMRQTTYFCWRMFRETLENCTFSLGDVMSPADFALWFPSWEILFHYKSANQYIVSQFFLTECNRTRYKIIVIQAEIWMNENHWNQKYEFQRIVINVWKLLVRTKSLILYCIKNQYRICLWLRLLENKSRDSVLRISQWVMRMSHANESCIQMSHANESCIQISHANESCEWVMHPNESWDSVMWNNITDYNFKRIKFSIHWIRFRVAMYETVLWWLLKKLDELPCTVGTAQCRPLQKQCTC